jgi:hypothetical protein
MSEQQTYTEGQFGAELSSMYFQGNKRQMLIFALLVLQSGRGLERSSVYNFVEHFEKAGVITHGEGEKVLKRFGQ